MLEQFLGIIVGIILIYLGIQNSKGNINSLHSYHRKRVKEEDRLAFGKMAGLGTMVVGFGIIIFNLLILMNVPYAEVFLFGSIIVGLGISFYAMIKYNKGIF